MAQLTKVDKISEEMCKKLIEEATKALQFTYPEASKGYSVAVLTKDNNIYTGASYSSDTETLTMHSEAVALAHAAQHGETAVVAITGPNCHICKQLIYESGLKSGIDILVIIEEDGQYKQIPITELMPYPWPEV